MRLFLAALILCLASSQAWACVVNYPAKDVHYINDVDTIVLGKVISANILKQDFNGYGQHRSNVIYTINVMETIKGNELDLIKLKNYPMMHEAEVSHFNNHMDDVFWANDGVGRTPASCSIYEPGFSVGLQYLFFIEDAEYFYGPQEPGYHQIYSGPKTSELIMSPNDKWLQYVREKVKEQASELSNE